MKTWLLRVSVGPTLRRVWNPSESPGGRLSLWARCFCRAAQAAWNRDELQDNNGNLTDKD